MKNNIMKIFAISVLMTFIGAGGAWAEDSHIHAP
jgi:hypothetical protein